MGIVEINCTIDRQGTIFKELIVPISRIPLRFDVRGFLLNAQSPAGVPFTMTCENFQNPRGQEITQSIIMETTDDERCKIEV